jgi:hypothetical protein
MSITNKFANIADQAAQTTNMTEAQSGGGDFTPPEAGPCRLRLIGYVELGKHMPAKGFNGAPPKEQNKVEVYFEVSGPKHPPREHDGKKYPHIIKVQENLSLNETARFFKLFQLLNYAGTARHITQLLGSAYKGTIIHREYKGNDGKMRKVAELFDKVSGSWKIEPPRYEVVDPETGPTGEFAALKVDDPITPLKCFIWDYADMEQWNSIFIEGQYAAEEAKDGKPARAARTKNVLQEKIKAARNFKDSPMYTLLLNNGQSVDLSIPADELGDGEEGGGDEDAAPAAQAGNQSDVDPLAGMGV